MGKKGSWFSKLKKTLLSTESKELPEQKPNKSKKKWFGKRNDLNQTGESASSVSADLRPDNAKLSVAATAMAACTSAAAIRIQTAFRGRMARRALAALKRLVRLKSMIHGQSVQRQATTTLHYMQTLARVQSQIRARRTRVSEENQALKRQLTQKYQRELERLRSSGGEDWNDSQQSKEKIEECLLSRRQATVRRERALAYAYSHQTLKNSLKLDHFTFLDPSNPQWGWSWLERWMATQPWKNRSMLDTEQDSNSGSLKSLSGCKLSIGGVSNASNTRIDYSLDSKPPSLTLPSKARSFSASSKIKSDNTKVSDWARDSRSAFSGKSGWYWRHSVAGSSVTEDERLVHTPSVPSYMAPTESVKARSRFTHMDIDKNWSASDASSFGSYQKRLPFTASLNR